jgi:hypothetical protein
VRSAACVRRLYACPAVHDVVRCGAVRCVQHLRLFLRLEVAVDRRSLAALHAVKLRRSAREHALVRVSVRPTRKYHLQCCAVAYSCLSHCRLLAARLLRAVCCGLARHAMNSMPCHAMPCDGCTKSVRCGLLHRRSSTSDAKFFSFAAIVTGRGARSTADVHSISATASAWKPGRQTLCGSQRCAQWRKLSSAQLATRATTIA